MAASDWVEIYSSYSDAELVAEVAELKKNATLYTAQGVGNKSYEKDLLMVQNRLQAAIRTQKLRSGDTSDFVGVADFSRVQAD